MNYIGSKYSLAVSDAFHKGLREAGIVLLEPIMKLEISRRTVMSETL